MNPKTFSLILFSSISFWSQDIKAADLSPIYEDQSLTASSGSKRNLEDLLEGFTGVSPSPKSLALMTPNTQNELIGNTSHLSIQDRPGNLVPDVFDDSDADEEKVEVREYNDRIDYLEDFFTRKSRNHYHPQVQSVPKPVRIRYKANKDLSPGSRASEAIDAVPIQVDVPELVVIGTEADSKAVAGAEDSKPVDDEEEAPLKITSKITTEYVPSLIEKSFWAHMFNRKFSDAHKLISSTFSPELNSYSFSKMQIIMKEPQTRDEMLRSIYAFCGDHLKQRYPDGRYIYSVSHPDIVNRMLSLFPLSVNIKLAILDDLFTSPESRIVLKDEFFGPLQIRKYQLHFSFTAQFQSQAQPSKILVQMFQTRPELFLNKYNNFPEGDFVNYWHGCLKKLLDCFRADERLKVAFFKFNAYTGFDVDEKLFSNLSDHSLVELFNFVQDNTDIIRGSSALTALYNGVHTREVGNLPCRNEESPLFLAITSGREDLVSLMMNHRISKTRLLLNMRNRQDRTPLQVAFQKEVPKELLDHSERVSMEFIRDPGNFIVLKQIIGSVSTLCQNGQHDVTDLIDSIYVGAYGNEVILKLLVLELSKIRPLQVSESYKRSLKESGYTFK